MNLNRFLKAGAVGALLICTAAAAQSLSIIRSGSSTNTAVVESDGSLRVSVAGGGGGGGGSAPLTPPKQGTSVAAGAACTVPGAANCRTLWPSFEIVKYARVAITIKNTGGNALTNCIIEFSPDGVSWEAWDTSTFAGLPAGEIRSMQLDGNSRRYIRVEASSTAGTAADLWLTLAP